MTKLTKLSLIAAGCLLVGGMTGTATAQPWPDPDGDWRGRGPEWRDWDRGRGRDRDWDRGPRWRDRDPDCYYVQRRVRDRYGDLVIRRYRVCDD